MKIKPIIFAGLVIVVFFGSILAFQTAGIWSISGKVTSTGEQVQPLAEDVNSIKGWMTIGQITSAFSVSTAELSAEFGLPADIDPDTKISDLETDTFSVTALRTWLQNRTSAPAPTGAVAPAAQFQPALQPTAPIATAAAHPQSTQVLPTQPAPPARTITGKTTFQELLDWGLPKDTIREILGGEMPDPSITIKDYVTSQGMEFSTLKQLLQDELDRQIP